MGKQFVRDQEPLEMHARFPELPMAELFDLGNGHQPACKVAGRADLDSVPKSKVVDDLAAACEGDQRGVVLTHLGRGYSGT